MTEAQLQTIRQREQLRNASHACGFCGGRSSTCEDCRGSGLDDASREAVRLRDSDRFDVLAEVCRLRGALRTLAQDWETWGSSPKELYVSHARELRALLGEI